jgi:hypothetical protein
MHKPQLYMPHQTMTKEFTAGHWGATTRERYRLLGKGRSR